MVLYTIGRATGLPESRVKRAAATAPPRKRHMNNEKLEQVWQDVCSQVKSYNNIDPSQINAFFSRLHPQAMSEGFLMLTADNDFIKTWIERHYVSFIKRALEDLYHVPFMVVIEVDISAGSEAPVSSQPQTAGSSETSTPVPAASSSAPIAPPATTPSDVLPPSPGVPDPVGGASEPAPPGSSRY